MARLKRLPDLSMVSMMKGTVDYYHWLGIPCARKWPSSPGHFRAPAVEAQWPTFIYAARLWDTLSPEIQQAYRETAHGTNLTGRDLQIRAYIKGYFPK